MGKSTINEKFEHGEIPPDRTEVKQKFIDPGPLCKCKAHRESPGPDHATSCPWFANTRLAKIHLRPEQTMDPKAELSGPYATFYFVPWKAKE
jgi:hypothetical protein